MVSPREASPGTQHGIVPQALTHLALISTAFQLDRSLDAAHPQWS